MNLRPFRHHHFPYSTLSSIIDDIARRWAIDQNIQRELRLDRRQRQRVASESTVNYRPIIQQQQHTCRVPSPDLRSPPAIIPTPAILQPNDNMPESIPFFYGDGRPGENPNDFLKRVKQSFKNPIFSNDTAKVNAFIDYLASNSVAEKWFENDTTPTDKITWDNLIAAFQARWPKEKQPVLTRAMKKEKLLAIELKEEEIGKLVGEDYKQEWGHIVWAKKVTHMANMVGNTNGELIEAILEKVPEIMRSELTLKYANWTEFLDGIHSISSACIAENRKHLDIQNNLINEVVQLKEQLTSLFPLPHWQSEHIPSRQIKTRSHTDPTQLTNHHQGKCNNRHHHTTHQSRRPRPIHFMSHMHR